MGVSDHSTVNDKDDTVYCNGLANSTGKPCRQKEWLPGTGVCQWHGARTFATAHKALRRSVLNNVANEINKVQEGTLVFVDNPFDSLNEALMDIRRWKEILEAKINMMREENEAWRYQDKAGAEQLRSEVALYERAQDRWIRAAGVLAKLNLEDRFQKLSEQQAASMMYIISEVLKRAGLDSDQREKARQLVPIVIQEMMTTTGKKRYI